MNPQQPPPDRDPIATSVGDRGARITASEIALMLVAAVRLPVVALQAERIQTSYFDPRTEAHLIMFWRAASAAAKDHGGVLPADPGQAREIVGARCTREIANDPTGDFYTRQVQQQVLGQGGLLDEAFAMPIGRAIEDEAIELLIRFLTERAAFEPLRRALLGLGPNDVPKDLGALAGELTRHANELAGLGSDAGSDAIVEGEDFRPPGATTFTTGETWLDRIMDGGQAGHETYALLGATGAGKSSLGVQIALNCAKAQAALAAEIGTDRAGHWYYFTYELTRDQVRERVYAYGAKVDRKSLNDKMVPLSTSARPETIKEYERELIVNSPDNPLRGERERIGALGREGGGSRSHFHIVDYSGHHPGQGVGGVEEVAAYLSRERAKGRRIGGVVIDYAGISISRYVGHRKLRPEAEYPLLNGYIDNVRTAVSIPFDCPSWVMHQLHGDFARKSAGAKVHHADAKGARNFADNADFAFGLPKYNEKTRLLTFWMTKSRRAAGTEDNVILRYDGRFSMFIEPGQEYIVDPFTGQIVPRDFAERLAPPAPRRSPPIDPRAGA